MIRAIFVERCGVTLRLSAPTTRPGAPPTVSSDGPQNSPERHPATWQTADAHHQEKAPPGAASLKAVANETHALRHT
jgi:hypothetical protein